MLTSYPYVPIGAEMGLNTAIQSYNGKLFFGFTGSEAAAPDVDIVPHLLDQAFAELRQAAGVKRRPLKTAKPSPAENQAIQHAAGQTKWLSCRLPPVPAPALVADNVEKLTHRQNSLELAALVW